MKVVTLAYLANIREIHRDLKIVHCHGVFDLFHEGHLRHLEAAKKFGDILVVTVTPDEYVNKGPGRPRFNSKSRAEMLAALEMVDYVAINNESNAVTVINNLRPNFYVKGPDYKKQELDITGGILEESEAVRRAGGQLVFTDDETESSTELINNFFSDWSSDQKDCLEKILVENSVEEVIKTLDDLRNLKVLVVGEPIIDTYIFCQPENISSKSPSISASYIREENYAGGALAVARHIDSLGCDVRLLSPNGDESFAHKCLNSFSEESGVKRLGQTVLDIKTPRKIRYITPFMNQRIFELVHLDTDSWRTSKLNNFEKLFIEESKKVDVVLVLDFGHGLWEGDRVSLLRKVEKFIAINVQTNSSNHGYNLFHKHSHFDFMVIDERELRLGMHDRFTSAENLLGLCAKEKITSKFAVTLGSAGSIYVDDKRVAHSAPTYFANPIDTTGAGDAFFALTSLLAYSGVQGKTLPFLGNLYAGLKTKIIGNKTSVNRVDLIRTINSLLK